MENKYGLYSKGGCGWTSLRNEEFQEEDVWGVFRERKCVSAKIGTTSNESSIIITPRRCSSTAAKMIPRSSTIATQEPKIVHQSAPVNVPDWSKIYGENPKKPSKNALWLDDNDDGYYDDDDDDDVVDDDDDDVNNRLPPHEWIAKKLQRTQISSFSVCEGAGRTLKGRDLSRVRNAVLIRTGFLEQ